MFHTKQNIFVNQVFLKMAIYRRVLRIADLGESRTIKRESKYISMSINHVREKTTFLENCH